MCEGKRSPFYSLVIVAFSAKVTLNLTMPIRMHTNSFVAMYNVGREFDMKEFDHFTLFEPSR